MNLVIKRFENLTPKEVYSILKLRNAVFIVEQNCAYQDCDDNDDRAFHLFIKEKDDVVAYLRILDKGITFDEIAIGRVVVEKRHRGTGLSRKIMNKAIDFVVNEIGETSIKIQAQSYLIEFYESLGFKAISEEYLEDEIPHIDMLLYKSISIK
ncbi:GNAT family N-acetyltransferase [Alkaliphilus sp. MSJ-5]|uniref:GNAT family N-acetyltransferase n=1 Tax=Alkaliphilus flagellatus TaxID=2841507 RepID=A0ABS6FZC1_9FIRM|nr:GNAT family N-acetyltransferase [Alkaliphilus flagellatus]MBU5675304.1 GNAT family N-acetyltransferase [Alkaliphilus flagellatus]